MAPTGIPQPFGMRTGGNSDSDYDSEGDSRRHRRRESSGRHRFVVYTAFHFI